MAAKKRAKVKPKPVKKRAKKAKVPARRRKAAPRPKKRAKPKKTAAAYVAARIAEPVVSVPRGTLAKIADFLFPF